jgi:hypothetical protein
LEETQLSTAVDKLGMGLKRAQSFRLDLMGNKVRVLYASVGAVRNCGLCSWNPYFRSSMRILFKFMLPVLGFFEEVRESSGVVVSIFKISIFFPVG